MECSQSIEPTTAGNVVRGSIFSSPIESFPCKAGIPDGLARAPDGGFWLALIARLSPVPVLLAPHPWLRQLASYVVQPLLPIFSKPWGAVV